MRPARPAFRCIAATAILVLAVAAASVAQAQSIDQYLPGSVGGIGIEPGVTVSSRSRPEYDVQPLHLGSFLVTPQLNETVGYDDNVTGTPRAAGSPLVETNATLQTRSDWTRDSLGLNLGVDDFEYPSQSNQSYTDWNAAIDGSYDIGSGKAIVSFTHLNQNQTSRDLDVPQLDHPIAYRVDDAHVGYDTTFNRLRLLPTLDVINYSYDSGTVDGAPYEQGYRDRVALSPAIEARYEVAPLRSLVLVLRDSEASYAHRLPGTDYRDYSDVSVLGGVSFDTGGLLRFLLLGGYEVRSFMSSQYKTISAPLVEGSAIYTPSGLTTVTASAARYIEDAATDLTVGYTESALKLRVDHEYLRNVLLYADGGLYLDDYAQNGGHQSFYTAGLGATWLLNRRLRLVLSYDYSTRRSDIATSATGALGGANIFGADFSENRVLLQLQFAL